MKANSSYRASKKGKTRTEFTDNTAIITNTTCALSTGPGRCSPAWLLPSSGSPDTIRITRSQCDRKVNRIQLQLHTEFSITKKATNRRQELETVECSDLSKQGTRSTVQNSWHGPGEGKAHCPQAARQSACRGSPRCL